VAAPLARKGFPPTKGPLPHPLWTAFKNDAQIVGRHWYGLCQGKTVTVRQIRDLGDLGGATAWQRVCNIKWMLN